MSSSSSHVGWVVTEQVWGMDQNHPPAGCLQHWVPHAACTCSQDEHWVCGLDPVLQRVSTGRALHAACTLDALLCSMPDPAHVLWATCAPSAPKQMCTVSPVAVVYCMRGWTGHTRCMQQWAWGTGYMQRSRPLRDACNLCTVCSMQGQGQSIGLVQCPMDWIQIQAAGHMSDSPRTKGHL